MIWVQCSTRSLIMFLHPWIRRFTMIISAWWLWTRSKFSGQALKKFIGTLDRRKLLNRSGYLQARSSFRNEKCADHPTVNVCLCPVTGESKKLNLPASYSRTVTRRWMEREVWGSSLGPVKSDTVLPTARHRCDISSKGALLPGRNDAQMGPANSLLALS